MKKLLASVLAVTMLLSATLASAATFPDLQASNWDWARDTVEELAGIGIVKGYSDGTYKPSNSVTKQEAFTLFARVIGVNDETNAQAVEDAQKLYASVAQKYTTYAVRELCFMLYRGILTEADLDLYLAENVKNTEMKRYEAAELILKIMGGEEEVENAVMFVFDYTDADAFPNSAKGAISYVTDKGIMSGMNDGTFSPNTSVTRAQIAIMLKRTMNALDVAYINGTASAVDETSLVVNGQVYSISDQTIIYRNGVAGKMRDIENGDSVTLTTYYKGVLSIDAEETGESDSKLKTEVIDGIFRSALTDSRGTSIRVYDKEAGVNSMQTYWLGDNVSYIVDGEPKTALSAIKDSDAVSITLVDGLVVSIVAESKTKVVENATISALTADGVNADMTIEHRTAALDDTTWPISKNAVIKKNKKEAALTKLLIGDTVKLTITYGEITEIEATSKTSTVKGTISAIHIERQKPYITISVSENEKQDLALTMDTQINIDGGSGSIYDLELGYSVTITTESETATKIAVTSVATSNSLTGTVTLVNSALGFLNMSVRATDGSVREYQIFVKETTSIIAGSSAARKKLSNIEEGDMVIATGEEKLGAFQAKTIVIVNK